MCPSNMYKNAHESIIQYKCPKVKKKKKKSDKMYKSATATCENIHESPKHNANKQVKQRLILLHNSILYKSPKTSF